VRSVQDKENNSSVIRTQILAVGTYE
jgi:hypothetical protein